MSNQLFFLLELPVTVGTLELKVILGVDLPVRHHGIDTVENFPTIRTDPFLVIPKVQPQAFQMLVGDATYLAGIDPFRRMNFPDVLLYDRRRCKNRRALRTLGALLGMPEHVTIQCRLTTELFRTVGTLVRHFTGVHPKVHLQRSLVEEPPLTHFALELLDSIVNLFVLLQGGAKLENLPTELTRDSGFLSILPAFVLEQV